MALTRVISCKYLPPHLAVIQPLGLSCYFLKETFLDLHLPTWVQFGVPMYSLHGTYHYLNIYEIR